MSIKRYVRREKNVVSERTLKTRRRVVEDFIRQQGEDPDVSDFEDYIDGLLKRYENDDIKASTIKEYYKIVKRYFDVMGVEGDVDHIKEWLPANDSHPGEYLKPKELNKFKRSINKLRDKALVDLMYYYARRPKEVMLLNREDIDLEEGTITFNILKKNNHETVTLELENGDEYEVLRATFEIKDEWFANVEKYLMFSPQNEHEIKLDGEEQTITPLFSKANGRITYSTIYNVVSRANDRSGVDKNITPKSLRHSRATHLDHAGESPEQIARHQLLHGPGSDVIDRYIHEKDEQDVREVMTISDSDE